MKTNIKDNTQLKDAMLQYAPVLANDYKKFVRYQWEEMVKDLGVNLNGVYNSWKWAKPFTSLKGNLDYYNPSMRYGSAIYTLNEQKLEANSVKYGEMVSLEWYNKMIVKLVDIEDVEVSEPRGGNITVNGTRNGHKVFIDQQRIINCSKLGTLFHQFPARIYVDGKAYSEAKYKKMF